MDWDELERVLNAWLGFTVVWLLALMGIAGFLWR